MYRPDKPAVPALCWSLIWLLGFAVLVLVSIRFADGHLVYTLDDPYIHLSVAENILHGGYGVNAQENSSPSSSVLFPLLLAPFVWLGWGRAAALIINTIATGLSVWLLLRFYWERAVGAKGSRIFPHLISALLILSINAFALPMTGMEHSLHVLLVAVTITGLVELAETNRASPLLLAAIVLMPFVRFEGLALSFATTLAMGLLGRARAAIALALAIVVLFLAYGLVMNRLGLPFFPSSVLVKSNVAASAAGGGGGFVAASLDNLRHSLDDRWGIVFAFFVCFTLVKLRSADHQRAKPEFVLAVVSGLSIAAHLIAGRYDWFHRYEVYAVAIVVFSLLYFERERLRRLMQGELLRREALVLGLLAFISPYLTATVLTPYASRAIYDQQFQMHRFATAFFPRPVAVNDLGWVSFENDNFVLDLWGLGSEKVRKLRAAGRFDTNAMAAIVAQANIDYAMIYEPWFDGIVPKSWLRVAVLESEPVSAAYGRVSFYATRPSVCAELSGALDRFAPTLPAGVHLTRFACE